MLRACKNDNFLSEENNCPLCGSPTSRNWSGFLIISDAENSQIASSMQIERPGLYALTVR